MHFDSWVSIVACTYDRNVQTPLANFINCPKTEIASLASRVSDRKAFSNCGDPKNCASYMSDVKIIVPLLELFLVWSILRFLFHVLTYVTRIPEHQRRPSNGRSTRQSSKNESNVLLITRAILIVSKRVFHDRTREMSLIFSAPAFGAKSVRLISEWHLSNSENCSQLSRLTQSANPKTLDPRSVGVCSHRSTATITRVSWWIESGSERPMAFWEEVYFLPLYIYATREFHKSRSED